MSDWGTWATSSLVVGLSLTFAILSYYLIEMPVLSLRHRRATVVDAPAISLRQAA